MRTLNADLSTAQETGYPVAGQMQPAPHCTLYPYDESGNYDYSFNPTVTTNRLLHFSQNESPYTDSGVILLNNSDHAVTADMTGYFVNPGWGLNTSSGIKNSQVAGAVSPRLWVMRQRDVSGAPKGSKPQLYTLLEMAGVWDAVLNRQPIRIGTTPYYKVTPNYLGLAGSNVLEGKTIYGVIEYLIETALSTQLEVGLSLQALGTQDDGLISSIIPFPHGGTALRELNPEAPDVFDTYGGYIKDLMAMTKCILCPRPGLSFKVIYPQAADSVTVTYYSTMASGHPFYEILHNRLNMVPNHVEVFGLADASVIGDWYDPDHYSSPPTYSGNFMPVTLSVWDDGILTEAIADARAAAMGVQLRAQAASMRLIIPMDARTEIGDRIAATDTRSGTSATYPVDTLTRVCGITRTFWAGKSPAYEAQLTLGGLPSVYLPENFGQGEPSIASNLNLPQDFKFSAKSVYGMGFGVNPPDMSKVYGLGFGANPK